jgi:hypothetical protein
VSIQGLHRKTDTTAAQAGKMADRAVQVDKKVDRVDQFVLVRVDKKADRVVLAVQADRQVDRAVRLVLAQVDRQVDMLPDLEKAAGRAADMPLEKYRMEGLAPDWPMYSLNYIRAEAGEDL